MAQWRLDRPEAEAGDPPLPPPPAVPGWVIDRAEVNQAIAAVCSRQDRAVGITAALEGAGGFGKTTLAEVVCANRRVRRHFRGRVYVVSVGRDVRGRAAIAAKVGEATRFITGDTSVCDDPDLGRRSRCLRVIVVVEDVGVPMILVAGQFVGSEDGRPDAFEVVLWSAEVDGEGLVQEADGGQGLLQAVDRAGPWARRPGAGSRQVAPSGARSASMRHCSRLRCQ